MFKNTFRLSSLITIVVIISLAVWIYYFYGEKRTIESFAHLGSYIGGLLGALFGGITVVMVIRTYHANQEVIKKMVEQIEQNERQLVLYAEEMEAMRDEAERSRGEARRSAEALTNQAEHLINRDAISYARDALNSYEEQISKLLSIEWQISELNFPEYNLIEDDIKEFVERGAITYSRLIKIGQIRDMETVANIVKGFDSLQNHRHYLDFKDELVLLLNRRSVNVSLLISHGASHSICELEAKENFNLLNELKDIDFINDREMRDIVSPVNEAADVRQKADSKFGQIKNSYRNPRLNPLKG
jgi:hypothetical protein